MSFMSERLFENKGVEIHSITQLRKELINYFLQGKTIQYSGVFRRSFAKKPREG